MASQPRFKCTTFSLVQEVFLFTERECPDGPLVAALKAALPSTGTVIVWNKTSEKGINAQLAERLPGEKAFLDDANVRIVD